MEENSNSVRPRNTPSPTIDEVNETTRSVLHKRVKHFDNVEPHFLTFSCYRRLPLLSKDRTRLWFVDAMKQARRIHGFHLWAWVIMPEHVHILLWTPPQRISTDKNSPKGRIEGILDSLKRPVAMRAIAFLRRYSPEFLCRLKVVNRNRTYHRFWQAGSGYDRAVIDEASLHAIIDYIHQNPVRRALVNRAEDWTWSSSRSWLEKPNPILTVDRTVPTSLDSRKFVQKRRRNE